MTERVLMNGNNALGEAAIRAGCACYFGYPITPQNELTAYMATHMPAHNRVFVQAESELAAINMVYGASSAGRRAMTSSSSPGISLKQEGISTLAGADLPAVIVNVQRSGPGIGNIAPAQGDYFQAVKGGGHGDYHQIVLAPDSVQEMHDLTFNAFDLADRYRGPVMMLTDGRLGQMMEPLELRPPVNPQESKPWATTGAAGRGPNIIRSLYLEPANLEKIQLRRQEQYRHIQAAETLCEECMTEDGDILLVAYGSCARICKGALADARDRGHRVGLLRPITLWPFPTLRLRELRPQLQAIIVVEMSSGQLIEDVRLAVGDRVDVLLENRLGGPVPTQRDVLKRIEDL